MKRGDKLLAGAALLVLPFVFSTTSQEQMREPKARALAILMGFWIGKELWQRVHPALGCATIAMFLSAAFRAIMYPVHDVLCLLAALGSCLWVAEAKEDDIKGGLEVLEISGLLIAAYAVIFQWGGHDLMLVYKPGFIPMGMFGQHTLYGPLAVAAFASALFMGRYFRAVLLFCPIPLIDSSFTYLSLATVLFFYALFRFGKRAILGALVLLLTFIAVSKIWPMSTYEVLNDKNRYVLWEQAIRLGERHWLLGHGIASFAVIYPFFQDASIRKANGTDDSKQSDLLKTFFHNADFLRKQSGVFLHPHNEAVSVFFEFGVVGLLIALWWAASFLWAWVHMPDSAPYWALGAIFFAFLANAQGGFIFHLIPQALLPLWAYVVVTARSRAAILEEYAPRAT